MNSLVELLSDFNEGDMKTQDLDENTTQLNAHDGQVDVI